MGGEEGRERGLTCVAVHVFSHTEICQCQDNCRGHVRLGHVTHSGGHGSIPKGYGYRPFHTHVATHQMGHNLCNTPAESVFLFSNLEHPTLMATNLTGMFGARMSDSRYSPFPHMATPNSFPQSDMVSKFLSIHSKASCCGVGRRRG